MSWTIREGRIEEVDRLVALRRAMFEGMGYDEPEVLERVAEASRKYFLENMPTGRFRVWATEVDGELVGSIGLVVHSVPPGPSNLVGKAGYIMNLVTLPPWRRCGIARALLLHVFDVLRAEGVPLATLHASSDGRGLYEELGFAVRDDLPEMRLRLG